MSNGTPLLVITNAGLAVASTAMPEGPYVHITSFEVGSAYGYDPQRTDAGLNGNLLFTGVPTSYEYIGNNTLNIICQIPVAAGPFQFGEVALYLDGGVMFAKGVFDEPQTKYSSLGTNVVTSYTFNCLLKLEQSVAVFQIDTVSAPPAVLDIYQWSDVYPPGVSANPDVPLYVVRELSPSGDSSLLQNSSDSAWTLGTTYYQVNNAAPVLNSSTTWVEFSPALFTPAALASANRQWVLETPDGFFRSVSSIVTSGANYRFNLNVTNDGTYSNIPLLNSPAVGSHCRLYSSTQSGLKIYYSQIIDPPPSAPLATVGTPGLAYGGSGLYMPQPGVIQAVGMLQSPSTSSGRQLTSADDLNSNALASGLYIATSGNLPANMPINWNCNIWVHNIGDGVSGAHGSDITQIAYPWNTGGGDSHGVGGYPPYWRQGYNNGANWTDWFPFSMRGKLGSGTLFAGNGYDVLPDGLILQWGTTPGNQTFPTVNFPITFPNACLRVLNSVSLFGPGNVANNNYSGVVSFTNSSAVIGADQKGANWLAIGY
jgi:hypothetical protein